MKHIFYRDESGNIDNFRYGGDIHNGPECMVCEKSECRHCSNWTSEDCPAKKHQIEQAITERKDQIKRLQTEIDLIMEKANLEVIE